MNGRRSGCICILYSIEISICLTYFYPTIKGKLHQNFVEWSPHSASLKARWRCRFRLLDLAAEIACDGSYRKGGIRMRPGTSNTISDLRKSLGAVRPGLRCRLQINEKSSKPLLKSRDWQRRNRHILLSPPSSEELCKSQQKLGLGRGPFLPKCPTFNAICRSGYWAAPGRGDMQESIS